MPAQTTNIYKIIAILLFLVLGILQFFLIYNTYTLNNEQLFFNEKQGLKLLYQQSIRNDKIFPGGQDIIDKYIGADKTFFSNIEQIKNPSQLSQYKKAISDSIIADLKRSNSPDSLMQNLIAKSQFQKDISWAIYLDSIIVTRDGEHYELLFSSSYGNTKSSDKGFINGNLKKRNDGNLISLLHVSSGSPHSHAITFSLHADVKNRTILVLQKMLPTLLLSLFSVLGLVVIFYFTFRNWIRQKKLAEMRTDFVNSITHEFHTPLSSIIVANKSLQNDKLNSDKATITSLTGVINRQSTRLKNLFDQVLDITLMNEASLQKKEVIFENFLTDIISDYRIQLLDENVKVELEEVRTNTRILLDPFWTTTMIINLLDNGIKYNNNEIKILVVSITPLDKKLELLIRDNGIGMPNTLIDKIFDKFYRNTEHVKNNAIGGLGLGLYYVKLCVDAHNWLIRINRNNTGGTDFVIQMSLQS